MAALMLSLTNMNAAIAEAPRISPLPSPRPIALGEEVNEAGAVVVRVTASALAPAESLRPTLRPGGQPTAAEPAEEQVAAAGIVETALPDPQEGRTGPPRGLLALLTGQNRRGNEPGVTAVLRSLRPAQRPDDLRDRRVAAIRNTPSSVAQPPRSGSVCGDRRIRGEELSAISGRINGCGIANPVRVTEIDGIALSAPATINCDTARAVQTWLEDSVVPEVGRRGGGVTGLRVIASYSCRTRNNQPGARLSEHSHGNAIDIAGIGLADGSELTVLTDWGSGREGTILRSVHQGACGPFGTVLGPNSDRYHRDHFHFDVASYRSGPYCR